MYTGASANVSVVDSAKEMSTSSGNRNAAICATEFLTTEIARSERPFQASTSPAVFSTALPAIATITRPAKAWEMLQLRRSPAPAPLTNQSETNADAVPATSSSASVTASDRRGPARRARLRRRRPRRPRSPLGGLAGRRSDIRAQVRHDPGDVDDQQADRADDRDRLDVVAGRIVRAEREPEQHDDEHGHLQQRRRVARQALGEAHHAVGRAARADHDHEAEHEQRVGEDRADDRRLRDDELALLQREDDDEQLGQVAERRLQHAGDAGPKRSPSCSVANDTTHARPASASVAIAKRGTAAQRAVVGDARASAREQRDRPQRERSQARQQRAVRRTPTHRGRSAQAPQWLSSTRSIRPYSERLLGREEAVALHVRAHLLGRFAGVLGVDLVDPLAHLEDLARVDLDVGRLALRSRPRAGG